MRRLLLFILLLVGPLGVEAATLGGRVVPEAGGTPVEVVDANDQPVGVVIRAGLVTATLVLEHNGDLFSVEVGPGGFQTSIGQFIYLSTDCTGQPLLEPGVGGLDPGLVVLRSYTVQAPGQTTYVADPSADPIVVTDHLGSKGPHNCDAPTFFGGTYTFRPAVALFRFDDLGLVLPFRYRHSHDRPRVRPRPGHRARPGHRGPRLEPAW